MERKKGAQQRERKKGAQQTERKKGAQQMERKSMAWKWKQNGYVQSCADCMCSVHSLPGWRDSDCRHGKLQL